MDRNDIAQKIQSLLSEHEYGDLDHLLDCVVKRTQGIEQLKNFQSHPQYAELLEKSSPAHAIEEALRETSIELIAKLCGQVDNTKHCN